MAKRSKARKLFGSQQTSILPILGGLFMTFAGYAGCEQEKNIIQDFAKDPAAAVVAGSKLISAKAASAVSPTRVHESVLIASFNIQVFGDEKARDSWIMERLAEVVRKFDIVAIQEIRTKDQSMLNQFLAYVNAKGDRYEYLLGPRLGRTTSKEQYAYIYDSTRIRTNTNCSYTLNDDIDVLHREPLIARFQVKSNRTSAPWTFTLVNLHTDPDVAQQECDAMGPILRELRNYEFAAAQEDDVILMGDLNAAPANFGKLEQIAGVRPLIFNQPSNVRETELYDNILIEPTATSEFTGAAGVFNLKDYFGLSMADALRLSDHNPVWAEFSVEEHSPVMYGPQPMQQQVASPYPQQLGFR